MFGGVLKLHRHTAQRASAVYRQCSVRGSDKLKHRHILKYTRTCSRIGVLKLMINVRCTPYKITSICQTTKEPVGLLIETISPYASKKVFIVACEGKDAYVDILDADEAKQLQAELNTYGKNSVPQPKSAPHKGIKMQVTAKAHLMPRQPPHPPQAQVRVVADGSPETSAITELVQPVRLVTATTVSRRNVGSVLGDSFIPTPERQRVGGCGQGCHPRIRAKAKNGEGFCLVWMAAAPRTNYVEWWKIKASKKRTKYLRHLWPYFSDDELGPLDNLINYLQATNSFAGCNRNDWEWLIRENMEGRTEKARHRWCFRVPISDLNTFDRMLYARGGTSGMPNDHWNADSIKYYGRHIARTIIQGSSGHKPRSHVQRLEVGQRQVLWKEVPLLTHASRWRNWESIWDKGITRGGPQDKHYETFLKRPKAHRNTPWGNFSDEGGQRRTWLNVT